MYNINELNIGIASVSSYHTEVEKLPDAYQAASATLPASTQSSHLEKLYPYACLQQTILDFATPILESYWSNSALQQALVTLQAQLAQRAEPSVTQAITLCETLLADHVLLQHATQLLQKG